MIVVHKYISKRNSRGRAGASPSKGASVGRAIAHMKYIQHRPGEDRGDGGREFFNETGLKLDPRELRELVKEMEDGAVTVHTLTLSPEINLVSKREMTIEVMQKLGAEKGQDLRWFAVEHNNTDHYHVHVVLLGKDRNGKDVRLNTNDYRKMREFGDAYLERQYPVEFAYARQLGERVRAEKLRQAELAKELAREERIRDGLELPWLHKKIVREQIEPYKEWKERQRQEKKDRYKKPDRVRREESIEAVGKKWTKEHSLSELRELEQHLWENHSDRIDKTSFAKLMSWIRQKERLESEGRHKNIEKGLGKDGRDEAEAKRDTSFEYQGKKYTEKSSYDELKGLNSKLREPKAERLSIDNYQSFRGWMENADRARWHGVLNKQIEQSKARFGQQGGSATTPDKFKSIENSFKGWMTVPTGPFHDIGRLVYEMLSIIDFSHARRAPPKNYVDWDQLRPMYDDSIKQEIYENQVTKNNEFLDEKEQREYEQKTERNEKQKRIEKQIDQPGSENHERDKDKDLDREE